MSAHKLVKRRKKIKIERHWIMIPSFDVGFKFAFIPNEKAWNTAFNNMGVKKANIGPAQYPNPRGGRADIVRMPSGDVYVLVTVHDGLEENHTVEQIYDLLVHEAVHVWQYFRDHIGEKTPSVEFEAYTVQYISGELMRAFRNTRGIPVGEMELA
jgi:hypothetical protein